MADQFAAVWFQDCKTQKEKEDRRQLLASSRSFINVLGRILLTRLETVERKGFREEDYADAGWVTLQAFRNGKIAELTEILNLLEKDDHA